jgi:hypothetical protein
LIPPPVSGIRKIKKCYLHILRKNHLVREDLALGGNELTSAVETTIPEILFSEQTYQYCGFTPAVAAELWSLFQANRDELPQVGDPNHRDYFLSFAFARIDAVPKSTSEDETEWTTALQDMGVDSQLQDAIMDPEFSDLRETESAAFWAKDAVDDRLYTIEEFRRASWQRVQQGNTSRRQAEREEQPSVESTS